MPYQVPRTNPSHGSPVRRGAGAASAGGAGPSTAAGTAATGAPAHYDPVALQNRLRHLEHVVQVLKAKQEQLSPRQEQSPPPPQGSFSDSRSRRSDSAAISSPASISTLSGPGAYPVLSVPSDSHAPADPQASHGVLSGPTMAAQPDGMGPPGALVDEHRYVNTANWEAILDDVSQVPLHMSIF